MDREATGRLREWFSGVLEGLEGGSVVASREKGGETGPVVVSAGAAREKKVLIAVVSAMTLHFVAFGAMVGSTVVDLLIREEEPREESKELRAPKPGLPAPEEMFVELNAAELLAMREGLGVEEDRAEPVPESPEELEPEDKGEPLLPEPTGFARTSPEQESQQAPEDAVLIGERNTQAASELAAVREEGPGLPTQDGKEPRRNERHLFDSDFSPGEQEGRADPEHVEEQKVAGDPEVSAEEPGEGQEAPQPVESLAEQGMPKEDLLESGNTVEVPVAEGNAEEEKTLPKEQDNEREATTARQGEGGESEQSVKEQVKEGGFRTESKKTRVEGTISRRGKSSFDVEATAVGRYKARVNRVIETEWQRLCVVHRDHLHPGILTLRFYVDGKGRVTGLRYLDVFHASEMQKGFTMQSVRQPRLPAMPADVVKELEGEQLEFRINFNF